MNAKIELAKDECAFPCDATAEGCHFRSFLKDIKETQPSELTDLQIGATFDLAKYCVFMASGIRNENQFGESK